MKNIIYIIVITVGVFLFSCSNTPLPVEHSVEKMISTGANAETSCPFLTKDEKGNVVLSWVKQINDSTTVMCYAVSNDNGYSFGNEIEITSSKGVHPHGENLPKIIFKPSGEIIAVWGASNPNPKNKYSGLIYYTQSFDEGKNWSNATPLVTDTASYDQRYFDFGVLQNGEIGMVWLDNRKNTTKEGMSLYYATTNGKNGFQNEKTIGETCCQCCRTDFFVDSKNNIHAAYRDIINDTIRDMVHTVSVDGGKTFSEPKRISEDNWVINGCPHTGPTMTENNMGLHFSWFTEGGGAAVYYCSSNDNGETFSPRQLVNTEARHPQIITLNQDNIGTVWDESVKKDSTYFSKIVLQITNSSSKKAKRDVTTGDVSAGFPVLVSNNNKTVVVAWVQETLNITTPTEHSKHKRKRDTQVFYRMLLLE